MFKLFHIDRLPGSQMYLAAVITLLTLLTVFFAPNADRLADRFKPTVKNAFLTVFLLFWCILSLSGVSSFLYFNF